MSLGSVDSDTSEGESEGEDGGSGGADNVSLDSVDSDTSQGGSEGEDGGSSSSDSSPPKLATAPAGTRGLVSGAPFLQQLHLFLTPYGVAPRRSPPPGVQLRLRL